MHKTCVWNTLWKSTNLPVMSEADCMNFRGICYVQAESNKVISPTQCHVLRLKKKLSKTEHSIDVAQAVLKNLSKLMVEIMHTSTVKYQHTASPAQTGLSLSSILIRKNIQKFDPKTHKNIFSSAL
jgi:hypothetical protein